MHGYNQVLALKFSLCHEVILNEMAQISAANGIMLLCTWIICIAQVSWNFRSGSGWIVQGRAAKSGPFLAEGQRCLHWKHGLRKKRNDFFTHNNDHLLMEVNSKTREGLSSILNIQGADCQRILSGFGIKPPACIYWTITAADGIIGRKSTAHIQ